MAETLRIDKYLWFARLTKTRALAQAVAEAGHVRIDGRVIDRAHCPVRVGNVLSFPLHGAVRVLRVAALPVRRGPPAEARDCYADLMPAGPAAAIASGPANDSQTAHAVDGRLSGS